MIYRKGMREHHRRAIEKAKARLIAEDPRLLVILVGGSIAKGIEREDSDVDLMVVISDEDYRARVEENKLSFIWGGDFCEYEGGYVEGRFLTRSFIMEAAKRGSEPTRHSFTGVYPIYGANPEIVECLPLIPVYPEDSRLEKISAFWSQMQLNRIFFWGEAKRRGDRYLQMRAASDIVLFGCRLILAHNRILFACQKRLIEQTLTAPQKPEGLEAKINQLLTGMTDEAKEDFCKTIESFSDWGEVDCLSRFQTDVEMSWYNRVHAVSEW